MEGGHSFVTYTHRGITRHLRDQVNVERVESSPQAHAGRGYRSFASGMAGADHDYVELFGELHGKREPSAKIRTSLFLPFVRSFILATSPATDLFTKI